MAEKLEIGSGNVYADLGHADAELKLAKSELARQIGKAIAERHLTATAAATVLGTDQPKVSKIINGQLKDFSLERLATFLTRLNRDVEIRVTARSRGAGRLRVKAA
jgi:predicted XRE-type DNA-binding protein